MTHGIAEFIRRNLSPLRNNASNSIHDLFPDFPCGSVDLQGLWNQPQFRECVRNPLLSFERRGIDRASTDLGAVDRALDHVGESRIIRKPFRDDDMARKICAALPREGKEREGKENVVRLSSGRGDHAPRGRSSR